MANSLNLDNGGERFNICLESDGDLAFKANNTDCNGDIRLTIKDDSGNVGIGTTDPQSLLQIGDGLAGGNRPWMTRGIQVAWNTDNVFLGLKDQGADRKDSVLAWGDNTNDVFRFIYVATGGAVDGQEIMRLEPSGSVGIGMTNPSAKLQVRGTFGLESATGSELWNLNVDSSGNLTFNSNAATGGTNRLFINDDNGNVGIGNTNPTQKLVVNGNVQANNVTVPSDLRYKEDIATIDNSLNKVLSMRGVRYQLRTQDFPQQEFSDDSQIGFIGQELESILPEVVFTDSEGYKSLDYSRLAPVLVEAIKEQQQLIEQQKSALGEALAKIAQLEVTEKK
ncbi:MAG: tail fiber domain-containing protein [Xenococcus sp. (in: cyanobacteria)]